MSETVRCPACRGSKKVAKLGGIIGDCNTCVGLGTIPVEDKPRPAIVEPSPCPAEIVKAVEASIPATSVVEPVRKVDGKKAVFMKKRA